MGKGQRGKGDPHGEAVEELVKELYGLGQVRREIARHALAELGTQGFNALATVYRNGPMRISDVAHWLAVDISVASRQLSALIDAGFVEREPSPDDRRSSLVKLTDAGHSVLRESHRRMVHAFGRVLEGWSREEVAALSDGLQRLSADFARDPSAAEASRKDAAR
jgi:DNA-binding MarR family transcriptional regulator